jgi:hypothetical protein
MPCSAIQVALLLVCAERFIGKLYDHKDYLCHSVSSVLTATNNSTRVTGSAPLSLWYITENPPIVLLLTLRSGKEGYEDKHNQKNRDRVGAVAKNKQHHQDQSEKNLGYQTAHKNQDIQAKRVQDAREGGLPGHLSADSNSKRNNATTKRLNEINRK